MNVQNPISKRTEHADLDRVLRAFFHAETPTQWIAPPVPPASPPATRSLFNGRMALAASLALLIGGLFYISRHTHFESTTGPERPAIDVASPAHKKPRATNRAPVPELPKATEPGR